MGGKSSKSSSLTRTNAIRQSQRRVFQKIKKKYDAVAKDLKSFEGDNSSPSYLKIQAGILNIKFELEELEKNLKDKHKETHLDWAKKIEQLLRELDEKAGVRVVDPEILESKKNSVRRRSDSDKKVEVTLVQLAMEKRNSQMSLKAEEIVEDKTKSQPSVEELRQKVLRLRKAIGNFKGEKNDDDYLEFKDALINIFIDIDNIKVGSNPQLRREKQLGLDDVQNCFKLLEEVTQDYDDVASDDDEQEIRTSRRSSRPVSPLALEFKLRMRASKVLSSSSGKRATNTQAEVERYSSGDEDHVEYIENVTNGVEPPRGKPMAVTSI